MIIILLQKKKEKKKVAQLKILVTKIFGNQTMTNDNLKLYTTLHLKQLGYSNNTLLLKVAAILAATQKSSQT